MNRDQRKTLSIGAMVLVGCLLLVGCGALSTQEQAVNVKAKYLGLDNRSVAVVVSASDHTSFKYPSARETITAEMHRRIKANVPGVRLSDPSEILKWQDDNPYWATRPPSSLLRQLGVERLVLVEIGEYRTHEPGDRHVLRGVISATVNVVEAEAVDPDNFAVAFNKTVMYPRPDESKVGLVGESESRVELITQMRFCEEAAGLFYDYQTTR